jgi:hypothetical protein
MFFVGLGPSFNLGLSGKSKGDDGDYDVKFGGGDEDDFKLFEIGLNALIGYQFKGGFFFSANSNTGLNDIGNDFGYDTEYHNWYVGINIGFMFKGKPKPAAPPVTN